MAERKNWQVLLAVDGSVYSDVAMKLMTMMPWPVETQATVLAVAPERWSLLGLSAEIQRDLVQMMATLDPVDMAAARYLTERVAAALAEHGLSAASEVRKGKPAEEILKHAATLPADLIAIGAKGLCAPSDFMLGSTAYKVAQYADCSVLVVRPPKRAHIVSVILAADGSPDAERVAELLCALSLPRWAEIIVVSVAEVAIGILAGGKRPVADVPEPVRRALLDVAAARADAVVAMLRQCGANVRSAVRIGHPVQEILLAAKEHDADLIAIGARGQTHTETFRLGGVAQKVVKYAPCSVLVGR